VQSVWRPVALRYDSTCSQCGAKLPSDADALWNPYAKKVRCLKHAEGAVEASVAKESEIDQGTPGSSTWAKYEMEKRIYEARFRRKYPRAAGFLLATRREHHTVRPWRRGAKGEEAIGKRLNHLSQEFGFKTLHDRQLPNSRANIDHIVVSSSGVYVIDAKYYKGEVRLERKHLFSVDDLELRIGKRNQTRLVDKAKKQVFAVKGVLAKSGNDMPVTGVLAFYRPEFPIFRAPESYEGILFNSHGGVKRIVSKQGSYSEDEIVATTRLLAKAFPAYSSSGGVFKP
jgi:hypothetical protein